MVKNMKKPKVKLIEKLELKHDRRLTWRETFKKYKNDSVQEAAIFGLFEFVPGKERGEFMDELYRILVPEGKAIFSVAYWNTAQAMQDYLYEFPALCEQSFLYFNKTWREGQGLSRGLKCDFDFCIDPHTLVLTADLQWIKAIDMHVGDSLVGVEEYAKDGGNHRRLVGSTVEFTRIFKHKRVKVVTDCTSIIVTPEHPFLARTNKRAYDWIPASQLTSQHMIKFVGQPWEHRRDDSWLSGIFDGEGCVVLPKRENRHTGINLTISQRPGEVLDKAVDILSKEIGAESVSVYDKGPTSGDCKTICVSGIASALRLMGIYRPVRLMSKIQNIIQNGELGLPKKITQVETVTQLEEDNVVALRTSSRTLITNGLISHNTYGYTPTPETQAKSEETRSFSIRHYNNTVQNLQLCLTKRLLT
jgi:hypothetical protein